MISISCENLSLSFGTDLLFENLSFSLNDGDKLGIVGVNGAGKSTLFRIIAGVCEPDTGNIYISREKTIGYLEQNPVFESDNTVLGEMLDAFKDLIREEHELEYMRREAENGNFEAQMKYSAMNESFIARGGLEYRGRCRSVLGSLGFDEAYHNMPIRQLSGGQKTRVALAKLLLTEPDIIMLDEPTNHLDIENIEWLEKFIAGTKKTVMIISHDRYFLCKTTNKTLEIENCHGRLYDGNYDTYIAKKKKDREVLEHQYKNQQKEISRLEAHIEQQRRWGREKNIKKAESSQKRLDRMEKIAAPEHDPQNIRMMFQTASESGNDVLDIRHLSKSYPVKKLFDDVSFELKKNDRAMLIGPNGCGKSTLLKIIYGTVPQTSGFVHYGYNVRVGYYDQEHHDISESGTVIDELWDDYDKLTQTEVRSVLALFLFKGDDVFKDISVLSGGEKARISLAKLMLTKVNFLILDEPTNHLDIPSREILEDALDAFEGTILAVSHDRYFINKLSTRILSFEGAAVQAFEGNYKEYLDYKERLKLGGKTSSDSNSSAPTEVMTDAKARYLLSKQAAAEKRKLENRYKKLSVEIEKAEKELEDNTLECETTAALDHVRLTELYQRNEELEEMLLTMWEERDSLKEELGI
ncbi:MAG: ABC-F family ATP-binding cassette domain-containing protein [Clostridia bacterium]|nr:ABC-F family ATP-binding cassette domain-containing protein [Clostridia bacterium]